MHSLEVDSSTSKQCKKTLGNVGWEGKRPPLFQSTLMCLLEAALAVYVFVLSNNKQTNKQTKKAPEAYILGFRFRPLH